MTRIIDYDFEDGVTTGIAAGSGYSIVSSPVAWGNYALKLDALGSAYWSISAIQEHYGRTYFRTDSTAIGQALEFRNGTLIYSHLDKVITTNKLSFLTSTTVRATSTTAIDVNTWYFLEWYIYIHPTTGIFQLKINGTMEIDYSGVTTQYSAPNPNTINRLYIRRSAISGSQFYDAVAANDVNGGTDNSWIGYPTSAGRVFGPALQSG